MFVCSESATLFAPLPVLVLNERKMKTKIPPPAPVSGRRRVLGLMKGGGRGVEGRALVRWEKGCEGGGLGAMPRSVRAC